MTKINDGGLAFPGIRTQQVGLMSDHTGNPDDDLPTYADVSYPGMSLRDWFAGQALAGMFACGPGSHLSFSEASEAAYNYADAMIAAREVAK